jgi:hypothetical protein
MPEELIDQGIAEKYHLKLQCTNVVLDTMAIEEIRSLTRNTKNSEPSWYKIESYEGPQSPLQKK